jgi:hypothetical protein
VVRKLVNLLMALMLFMFLPGCDEEPERLNDYLVDLATRIQTREGCRYRLDNNRLLIPLQGEECSGNNGQRVILNYSLINGDTIRVNAVSDIFTDGIRTKGFPEGYGADPVKIQSVWISGGYLNLIFETEYHSQPHRVALFRDTRAESIDLWFSHSREGDPPGYPEKMYASFSLDALRSADDQPIDFRLFIHTGEGLRTFHFTLQE